MFKLVLCETNEIFPKETTGVSKHDGDKWYSNHTHTHRHRHTHTSTKNTTSPLDYLQLGCDPIFENFDLDLKNGGWTTKLGIRRIFVSPLSKLMRQNKSGLALKPIPVPSVE